MVGSASVAPVSCDPKFGLTCAGGTGSFQGKGTTIVLPRPVGASGQGGGEAS